MLRAFQSTDSRRHRTDERLAVLGWNMRVSSAARNTQLLLAHGHARQRRSKSNCCTATPQAPPALVTHGKFAALGPVTVTGGLRPPRRTTSPRGDRTTSWQPFMPSHSPPPGSFVLRILDLHSSLTLVFRCAPCCASGHLSCPLERSLKSEESPCFSAARAGAVHFAVIRGLPGTDRPSPSP